MSYKYVRSFMISLVFIILTIFEIKGQEVHFSSPTNGQVVTNVNYSSTQVYVDIYFGYTGSTNPTYGLHKIILITDTNTYSSFDEGGIPYGLFRLPGNYTWKIELYEGNVLGKMYKTAEQTITFSVKFLLTISNNINTGILNIDGVNQNSGYILKKNIGEQVQLSAIDQTISNVGYLWNTSGTNNSNWQRLDFNYLYSTISTSRNHTYTIANDDNNARIISNLRKVTNITFQNNFISVGNGGVINVNSTQVNSPTASYSVVELNPITATAVSQGINNITYYFTNWSTGSTNFTETFYPTANSTITANFVGIAAQSIHLNFESSNPNLPITLHWDEYPNSNVTQYQIWRRVKYKKQPTEDPVLIATVSRGTTSYVDYDFRGSSSGFTDWMLWYDVRSYYSTEGTHPNPYWWQVFSDGPLMETPKDTVEVLSSVNMNSLDNFPNPFNPSTVIKYQIVKAGQVTLKVYDTLGREVANLVDKDQPSGSYSVNFNASSLASGIYLYRITANGFTTVKKMLHLR